MQLARELEGRNAGLSVARDRDQPDEVAVGFEDSAVRASMRPTTGPTDSDDPEHVFGRELEDRTSRRRRGRRRSFARCAVRGASGPMSWASSSFLAESGVAGVAFPAGSFPPRVRSSCSDRVGVLVRQIWSRALRRPNIGSASLHRKQFSAQPSPHIGNPCLGGAYLVYSSSKLCINCMSSQWPVARRPSS